VEGIAFPQYRDRYLGLADALARVCSMALSNARAFQRVREAEKAVRGEARAKDRFLAMLSHELRNPLASVRNSLHVLQETGTPDERARRATAVIDRQTTQLARLVEDLLDLTRIGAGKIRLQKERIDLADVLRRCAEDHRPAFARAGVALRTDLGGPAWVDGDPTRLSQMAGNLLHNASKFTPAGGRATISLRGDGPDRVRFEVSDDGIGLDAAMLERVFEPFAQADGSLDRSRGGLGLGLALVKELAQLHGGAASVESEGPGRGACVWVTLPAAPAPESVAIESPDAVPGAAWPRRVLVVDDNADSAESLREALELGGHAVQTARDGPEALRAAKAFSPEVVLCDIGLPGMDGFEVARAFGADPALRGAYLVALSGYAQPEDRRRAEEAGFRRHVPKPPDLRVLEGILADAGATS